MTDRQTDRQTDTSTSDSPTYAPSSTNFALIADYKTISTRYTFCNKHSANIVTIHTVISTVIHQHFVGVLVVLDLFYL